MVGVSKNYKKQKKYKAENYIAHVRKDALNFPREQKPLSYNQLTKEVMLPNQCSHFYTLVHEKIF